MRHLKPYLIIPLFFLALFSIQRSTAQTCATPVGANNNPKMMDYKHVPTNAYVSQVSDKDFCVKVRVYHIKDSNGNSNISDADLNGVVGNLNSFFPSGITFELEEAVIPIESTTLYDRNYVTIVGDCISVNLSQFSSDFPSTDAIDIYFNGKNQVGGFANGIASESQIYLGYGERDSAVLAHEMGHVFGLFHPYHGTTNDPLCENNDGQTHIRECINGTVNERSISGDFVIDTEADAKHPQSGAGNCPITPDDGVDACGDFPYNAPQSDNFMGPWVTNCGTTFTPFQVVRMKYYMWEEGPVPTLPMHSAISDCPVIIDPDPCDNCNNAENAANNVFNTLTQDTEDCGKFTISWPMLNIDCPDEFIIDWNNGGLFQTLSGAGDTAMTTYATGGLKTVSIQVVRDGLENCGTFDYTFNVDLGCDTSDCDPCTDVADAITDSVIQTISSNCSRYRATIPDIDNCYTGFISWGDGITEPLQSGSNMTHQYTQSGNFTITVSLAIDGQARTCAISSTEVSVTCSNECSNPCAIDPSFTYNAFNCSYNFDGENLANNCSNSIYEWRWRINGDLVSTQENFTYDFSNSQGNNSVELQIIYSDRTRQCQDTYTETIFVNCSGPACYDGYTIHFNDLSGGGTCSGDGQANLTGNLSNVASVDWTWALGGNSGSGASTGTTSPIYYPGGNWNGYDISISATINFTDGTSCSGLQQLFPMDCGRRIVQSTVSPNPTSGQFSVIEDGASEIAGVVVRNFYGVELSNSRGKGTHQFDLSRQTAGIYFVEISYENGTSEIKKVILNK